MHIRHVINTHHNHIYTIIESVIQKRKYFTYQSDGEYRYEAITDNSNTEFILFLNPTAIRKKVNKNIRNYVAINNT